MKRATAPAATLAVVALLVSAGCSHASAPVRVEGTSSLRFIEPAAAPSAIAAADTPMQLQPVDVLVPAEPIEPLVKPVYPRDVLGRQTTPVVVTVRLRIDEQGRVADVSPSLAAFSTPGPFDGDFRAAIDAAVAQWRFRPAEQRRLKPVKGGRGKEDYWLVIRAERTDYACDVAFTFNATGDVLAGVPKP